MTISSFKEELHGIDPQLDIRPSGHTPGLAGVYYQNEYLFAVPDHNIYDEPDSGYNIFLPSGVSMRHRTRPEALAMAKKLVHDIKSDPDFGDAMMGAGKYSDKNLEI